MPRNRAKPDTDQEDPEGGTDVRHEAILDNQHGDATERIGSQKSFVRQELIRSRAVVNEGVFEEYAEVEEYTCRGVWQFVKQWCKSSYGRFSLKEWPLNKVSRKTIPKDMIAGLSVGVLLIPQSMAYASLAGLPAAYGLYSSTVPLFIYTLLGSSTVLSVGPVAPIAILIKAALEGVEGDPVQNALTLGFMTGVVQLLFGMLRFGFIANLLSWPIMSGYTTAASFIIVVSQVESLLQLNLPDNSYFPVKVYYSLRYLGTANGYSSLIGIVSLIILFCSKYISFRGKKLPKWFPIQLLVTILTVLLSYLAKLHKSAKVDIVGHIPSGFPEPALPDLSPSLVSNMASGAIILSVIVYVGNISLATVFGKEKGESISPNMELIAVGAACLGGSFFRAFPVGGSFSRTAINYDLGAATPLALSFTGMLLVCVVLFLAPLFEFLPTTVLAAMVIASVKSLIKFEDAKALWRNSKRDCFIFWVTFLATLFIGIDNGVLAAMGMSLVMLLYRSFKPRVAELARLPNTDVFMDVKRFPQAQFVPGVVVLRVDGELHYGNSNTICDLLKHINRKVGIARSVQEDSDSNADFKSRGERRNWGEVRGIVLDGCRITDIDAHAMRELQETLETIKNSGYGLAVVFASFPGPVRDKIWNFGLLRVLGANHIHLTVPSAVTAIVGDTVDLPTSSRSYNKQAVYDALFPGRSMDSPDATSSPKEAEDGSSSASKDSTRSARPSEHSMYTPRTWRASSADENIIDELS
eukprot:gb/GECG01009085.1/.p1 GENE.gb/GECG01009085.1/~~gb/GECG01009085.1/.p1  ORF type:complete len:752 (+),score=68.10 gb/GECG01009085.1/:1-2256(+)